MKYQDFLREVEKDSEYNAAKEALKSHFALSDAVLRARMKRGWSQTELAERVGTKQANISRIEAGLGNPTLNLIHKLIQTLDLEVHFTPAVSSTTYRAIIYNQPGIPVYNWPGTNIQIASNSQKEVLPTGEQK